MRLYSYSKLKISNLLIREIQKDIHSFIEFEIKLFIKNNLNKDKHETKMQFLLNNYIINFLFYFKIIT